MWETIDSIRFFLVEEITLFFQTNFPLIFITTYVYIYFTSSCISVRDEHPSKAIKGRNDGAINGWRSARRPFKAIPAIIEILICMSPSPPCQKSKQCPNYDDDRDGRKGLSWLRLTLVLQITGFRFDPLPAEWRIIRLETGPRTEMPKRILQERICIGPPASFLPDVCSSENERQFRAREEVFSPLWVRNVNDEKI